MLIPALIILGCLAAVAAVLLLYFIHIVDTLSAVALIVCASVLTLNTQPADAAPATDADWPTTAAPLQPLKYAYNIIGDKVVLFANFCAGDNARADHMHMFGVYNAHGSFVAGGCWKYDPANKRTIEYFDLNGAGWSAWPRRAFESTRDIDAKCRGNSGDAASTWHYCNMRDAV